MANIEALEETLAYIEAHPEQHDQSTYGSKTECETTACFAGTRLLLTGQAEHVEWGLCAGGRLLAYNEAGEEVSCFEAAQKSLDLTEDQAQALFLKARDLEDVKHVIELIKNGESFEYDDEYEYDEDDWV